MSYKKETSNKCKECQFEEEHSQGCSKYKKNMSHIQEKDVRQYQDDIKAGVDVSGESHIQEIEKLFDETLGYDLDKAIENNWFGKSPSDEIKSFLRSSHLKYLTNKKKELEGYKPFGYCSSCDECPCKMKYKDGYNLAKQEEIETIDKEIYDTNK